MNAFFQPGSIVRIFETDQGMITTNVVQIVELGTDGFLARSVHNGMFVWYNLRSVSFHAVGQIPDNELKVIMEQIDILKEEGRMDSISGSSLF